jgi:hypothetical protein
VNDKPGGGCGGCLLWIIGIAIVLAVIGAVVGVGPFAGDRYVCYPEPVGQRSAATAHTGLTEDEAYAFLADHPRYAQCFLQR